MSSFVIDDSEWDTARLSLSPGWNMIGSNASEDQFVNEGQVAIMRGMLDSFQNRTVSWTTSAGSSNELRFNGTGIKVYGMAGPTQGSYTVYLDDTLRGRLNATIPDTVFNYTMIEIAGLTDGAHNLTMVNLEEGRSLVFDYAIVNPPKVETPAINFSNTPNPFPQSTQSSLQTVSSSTAVSQSPYTAAQLASIQEPYQFRWDGPLIFVITFSAVLFLVTIGIGFGLCWLVRKATRAASMTSGGIKRRNTLMNALKSRRIGLPNVVVHDVDAESANGSFKTQDGLMRSDFTKQGDGW